jgi:hypothetical protein
MVGGSGWWAPRGDAQRLRRAAERKGKAEDQFQLGRLLYLGRG